MISELAASSALALQTFVTWLLLASVSPDRYAQMEWALLTLLGASGAAIACFCLNTRPELRKIVVGRCMVTVFFGVIASRLVAISHPLVMELLNDPLILVGSGAAFGFIGWMLSRPVFQRAQDRAEEWAHYLVQIGEQRLAQQVAVLVAGKAAEVAEPLAQKVEEVAVALENQHKQLPQKVDVTIHSDPSK